MDSCPQGGRNHREPKPGALNDRVDHLPAQPAMPWMKTKYVFELSLEVWGSLMRAFDLPYSSSSAVCCHRSVCAFVRGKEGGKSPAPSGSGLHDSS